MVSEDTKLAKANSHLPAMRFLIFCCVIFVLIDLSLKTRGDDSLVGSDAANNLHIETHFKLNGLRSP